MPKKRKQYATPVKKAFRRGLAAMQKKLGGSPGSRGVPWVVDSLWEESGPTALSVYFRPDGQKVDRLFARHPELTRVPGGTFFLEVSQWESGVDEFQVASGVDFEESGRTEHYAEDDLTATKASDVLVGEAFDWVEPCLNRYGFA